MNKKGFMIAELIVVSAIVLMFLAGLFISYNKIYTGYTRRLSYYDAGALYRLDFYRDYYSSELPSLETQAKAGPIKITEIQSDKYNENVFLIYNAKSNLKGTVLDDKSVNRTYKEYVTYLSTAANLVGTPYVMVIERCQKDNVDYCKYGYLEVYDETQ